LQKSGTAEPASALAKISYSRREMRKRNAEANITGGRVKQKGANAPNADALL